MVCQCDCAVWFVKATVGRLDRSSLALSVSRTVPHTLDKQTKNLKNLLIIFIFIFYNNAELPDEEASVMERDNW